jgi:hypothetical protein
MFLLLRIKTMPQDIAQQKLLLVKQLVTEQLI